MTRCLNCRKVKKPVDDRLSPAEYQAFLEKEHGLTTSKDKLELLTEDYEYAVGYLDEYLTEHLEIIEEYFNAAERIAHCKKEIEDEAKERARNGVRVNLSTENFRFFIRKSAKRVVDPLLARAKSTKCYEGTTERMMLSEVCPDLFHVSLKKLDEYVEQGVINQHVYSSYVTEGEPTYAFHLEKKGK